MKKIFKFSFVIFMICGTFVFMTLCISAWHHFFAHSMGISRSLYQLWITAFKYAGIATVLTVIPVFANAMIRGWQAEGSKMFWVTLGILLMVVIAPVMLMGLSGHPLEAFRWLGLVIAGTIIGSGGHRYSVPFENGPNFKSWQHFVESF